MSTTLRGTAAMDTSGTEAETGALDKASAAFGQAAVIAIIFNTLLAWVKDAYDPLNNFMASLTGHHWITHSLVDIAVFVGLGFLFLSRGTVLNGMNLVVAIVVACIVGGGGLALWFILF
jgi:membrane-bound metal-dependent hydrolase YbcI (DUF457 family)